MNASTSYYVLTFCDDGVFEALPVSSWSVLLEETRQTRFSLGVVAQCIVHWTFSHNV